MKSWIMKCINLESIWISFKWNENASLQDQFYNYN